MEHQTDKEIDLLLRRYGRRETAASHDGGVADRSEHGKAQETGTGTHLDADELNVYAEGALPAATRARYTAHLAECAMCRSSVTRLALAANILIEERKHGVADDVKLTRTWWGAIAALFAPPMLRYVVPALALLIVSVVAFVVTRERKDATLLARNEPIQVNSNNAAQADSNTSATATVSESETQRVQQSPATEGTRSDDKQASSVKKAQETSQPSLKDTAATSTQTNTTTSTKTTGTTAAPSPSAAANVNRSATAQAERKRDDDSVQVAQAKPAPAPPQSTPATGGASAVASNDEQSRNERAQSASDRGGVASTSSGKKAETAENKVAVRNTETLNSSAPSTSRQRAARKSSVASRNKSSDNPEASDVSTETRRAGGRRFRRQDGAWIDTAYNSSLRTINVARGSEQYRALLADEPGLRSISSQLDGVVIVVWKGTAYRLY